MADGYESCPRGSGGGGGGECLGHDERTEALLIPGHGPLTIPDHPHQTGYLSNGEETGKPPEGSGTGGACALEVQGAVPGRPSAIFFRSGVV